MNISIPQIVIGIISMFIGLLGVRIISPLINTVFGMTWKSSIALITTKLVVYLVIAMIIYVIIYGTVMGRMPNLLKVKQNSERYNSDGMNDLGW
jgi:uncharacterized membrane protein